MANAHMGTLTGVNGGELTEKVLCLVVAAHAVDLPVDIVVSQLSGITAGVSSTVTGLVREVSVVLDTRAVSCLKEVEDFFSFPEGVRGLMAPKTLDTLDKVKSVLFSLSVDWDDLAEIRTTGGCKDNKDDCQLVFKSGFIEFISLKNGGWGQYRQQGCTKSSFESAYKFIMPGFDFDSYWDKSGFRIESLCKLPALRYSKTRGDYAPELRSLLQSLLTEVQCLHRQIEPLLQTRFARRCLSRGLVSLALGESADSLTYLDVARPDLGPVRIIREDAVDALFNTYRDFTVSFDKDLREMPNQNSFTTTLKANGEPILRIVTTGSTNRCPKGIWSGDSRFVGVLPGNIRTVKPQSPFALSDGTLELMKSI